MVGWNLGTGNSQMTGRNRARIASLSIAILALAVGARAQAADGGYDFGLHDPTYLMVGVGGWEFDRSNLSKPELDLILRPAHSWWVIKPQLGVTVAGDGDVVAFAGPLVEYYVTPHLVGTVSTSIATWFGSGFNLGSRVEFHSSGEVAWRFDDASRLGVGLFHTSNADLTKRNPGSDSLVLTYAIPIRIQR
jgi:hypothetical protein